MRIVLGGRRLRPTHEDGEPVCFGRLVGDNRLHILALGHTSGDALLFTGGVVQTEDGGGVADVLVRFLFLLDQPLQHAHVCLDGSLL